VLVCLALPAIAAAGAPEYGRCVKQAGGTFTTSKCTAEATSGGSWEWEPGPGPKGRFTAVLKGTSAMAWHDADGGYPGECKHASLSGEYTGPKTVGDVRLAFSECDYPTSEPPDSCPTIEVAPLVGELGVYALGETAEKNKIGLKLSPESGTSLAEFHCGSERVYNWRGGFVIGQASSNVMQLTMGSLTFRQRHGRGFAEQQPGNFLGEAPSPLETTGDVFDEDHEPVFTEMGWQMALAVHNEERIEANSVA
jgi:hypothetical protein